MRQGIAFNPVRAYLPETFWTRRCMYFSQGVDFNTLAASAVAQTQTFSQELNSDFLCTALSAVCTTDATGATEQPFFEFTAQITLQSGGMFWGSGFQHGANVFGRMANDGTGPHMLEYGQYIPGGENVTVTLNNLEVNARRIWITFHGVKIFNTDWPR